MRCLADGGSLFRRPWSPIEVLPQEQSKSRASSLVRVRGLNRSRVANGPKAIGSDAPLFNLWDTWDVE